MAPPSVPLRICSLNVGGRNTNSFEFDMTGDDTPLAQRWAQLRARGADALAVRGPAHVVGLAACVARVRAFMTHGAADGAGEAGGGGADDDDASIARRLLAAPTWLGMLAIVSAECPALFNALNLATLQQGRPSPFEAPQNVADALVRAALPPPPPDDDGDGGGDGGGDPRFRDARARADADETAAFLGAWEAWLRTTETREWARLAAKREVGG